MLFSAAYRPDAGLRVLWTLPEVELVSSAYAVMEAQRNLATAVEQRALVELLREVEIIDQQPEHEPSLAGTNLPEKDLPILAAAVAARCTHLITGDARHFGQHFGAQLGGVLILRPAAYLARRGSGGPGAP